MTPLTPSFSLVSSLIGNLRGLRGSEPARSLANLTTIFDELKARGIRTGCLSHLADKILVSGNSDRVTRRSLKLAHPNSILGNL